MKYLWILALLLPLAASAQLSYPVAHTVDQVDTFHGVAVSDPYRWLESYDGADTKKWIAEERSLTRAYLDSIPFREDIHKRLARSHSHQSYSAPYFSGGYFYHDGTNGSQDQTIFYRIKAGDTVPEVVLDPNGLSEDHTTSLEDFDLSKDGRYGAYTLSKAGSDWHEIYVMDMKTLRTIDDTIRWVKFSGIAWQGDGFYYTAYPRPRPGTELTATISGQKVFYHRVGAKRDSLIYQGDPDIFYHVAVSEDEQYLFLSKRKRLLGNALYYRHRDSTAFVPIVGYIGSAGFSFVCADSLSFIISTGAGTIYGKLMAHDIKTGVDRAFITPDQDPIGGIATGGGKIFITYMHDVSEHVYVYNMKGEKENEITLPEHGSVSGFDGEVGDTVVYYTYTSFIQPSTIYQYHIASRQSTIYRASTNKFDPSLYEIEQVFYSAADMTKVPMYIVHRKGIDKGHPHPLLFTAYGGYGISSRSTFSSSVVPFLDAGGIYAVANIRGGGEYGGYWHVQGSFMHKMTSFTDFISGAKYLISHKYTDRDHLAIRGGSNGGLLVAACANMHPELFKVVICEVPATDMLRYALFTAGPGWVREYGSPDNKAVFDLLRSYSPLHNVSPKKQYPAILVTTADHDDRVVPAHSYKYVATLQSVAGKNTKAPILIRIDTNSGHSGSSASKHTTLTTDIFSFLFYNMGITPVWSTDAR